MGWYCILLDMRQSGRTTRAIQSAPQGAIHVWHAANTLYATQLAGSLGRGDLRFVSVSLINAGCFLGMGSRSMGGRSVAIVIDDHARQFIPYDTWLRLKSWAARPGCEVIS